MKFLEPVVGLENYVINQVSCGAAHSLAVNEWGQLFTWGSNVRGQLANEDVNAININPKLVKQLATKHIVQIASGQYHSIALTNSKYTSPTVLQFANILYSHL